MKITNLEVSEKEGVMSLSFSSQNPVDGQDTTTQFFKDLIIESIKSGDHEWNDIDHHLAARFDEKSHRIEIKEKNNPPGLYGHASIIQVTPSVLLSRGLISAEQMKELDVIIKQSKPVVERTAKIVKPSYATPERSTSLKR